MSESDVQQNANPSDHLLLDTIDLFSLGTVVVEHITSINPLYPPTSPLTSPLPLWEEAFATSFTVHSRAISIEVSFIDSRSYKFSTPLSATAMIDFFPMNTSIISPDIVHRLESLQLQWKSWYQPSDEYLPIYVFLLKYENYIGQITLETSLDMDESGLSLFNNLVDKMISKTTDDNNRWHLYLPMTASTQTNFNMPNNNINTAHINQLMLSSPQSGYEIRGENWEMPCKFPIWADPLCLSKHHYVTWPQPNGHHPAKYYGGGAACSITRDCIDEWLFSNTATYTRFGVSELFYLSGGFDARVASAYSATFDDPPVIVTELLNISPSAPKVGERVIARFKIKNNTSDTVLSIDSLAANNFPPISNIPILLPLSEYIYSASYTFSTAGSYFSDPRVKINGAWARIPGGNTINFTVYNQNQVPPVSTPTPPPTAQGVTVVSAWPQGVTGVRGQEVRPEVIVQTNGFSLNCNQDFLENRDGNRYGAHPIQGCVALGGNRYKIAFGTPMRLPDATGEYHSRWQIWHSPSYVGPQIDIWFRVAQAPDHGQPPTTPTLRSPSDLHTERTGRAPELCWNPSTDPDGEPVKYFVEVRGGRIEDSDWITQTCWRPTRLDGPEYYGYEWRVKAQDPRGIESGWSSKWRFGIQPAPYDPPIPTSTPPIATIPPTTQGTWWNTSWSYRRALPIITDQPLAAGTIIKVDGMDLETLVLEGKARSDHNDLRIVRRIGTEWQEIARAYFTGWDLEFRLVVDIQVGTNTDYYLYYGNPAAGVPPSFILPQGWWADMYVDKGFSSYHSTWEFNQTMDFNRDGVCYAPLDHFGHTGQRFDESDKFRGRLFVPKTGWWTFKIYTNDGYSMYLNGSEVGRHDLHDSNDRWLTTQTIYSKAGWHTLELRNWWVNCGSWKFAMEGPDFPFQIVPATHFQRLWGNIQSGIVPGNEELAPTMPTPTVVLPSPTPSLESMFGDGYHGDLFVGAGETRTINIEQVNVSAIGTTAAPIHSNGFQNGDIVLFHQSQGTTMVGRWELNRITTIESPTRWTLATPLQSTYDNTNGRAQVIKVPRYQTITIQAGGILTAPAWNGSTGGILIYLANNTVHVQGSIAMAGKGFRGGPYAAHHQQALSGEGLLRANVFGTAANGNGGGGAENASSGVAHSGGGGGGNGTSGTSGHLGHGTAGVGGISEGDPTLAKGIFGGGGGGGVCGWEVCTSGNGGNGGGFIIMVARTIEVTGPIIAHGHGGQNGDQGGWAGAGTGGGGAGGSILIRTQQAILSEGQVAAHSGAGGIGWTGGAATESGRGGIGRIRIEYCTNVTGTTSPPASMQSIVCPGQ